MRKRIWLGLLLCAIAFAFDFLADIVVEGWWFDSLGYSSVYWPQVLTRALLAVLGTGTTGAALGINLGLANGWQTRSPEMSRPRLQLKLIPLLGILMGTGVLLASVLIWQWEAASDLWGAASRNIPQGFSPLPVFPIQRLGLWAVGGCLLGLVGSRWLDWAIAIGMSLSMGFIASEHWTTVLSALHPTSFPESDPIFGRNIGFYIFELPLWELIRFGWLQGSLVAFLSVLLSYLRSGNSLSEGYFAGFTPPQKRHLYGLVGSVMGACALNFWLSRYALLYSALGAIVGAGFTDIRVALPARTGLSMGAVLLALMFVRRSTLRPKPRAWPWAKTQLPTRELLVGYGIAIFLGTVGIPGLVQLGIVQPNELAVEKPYIAHSIQNTRKAFDLETIDVKPFNPRNHLTPALIQANRPTIRNIRLWDTRPLLAANQQLQRFRPYYQFSGADIDRYTLKVTQEAQPGQKASPTETRQVLISPRELDYSNVVEKAKTWTNQRLIYTHGYGFTLSPVNIAAPSGLPEYFVKDIGTSADRSSLQTLTPEIGASIPIQKPRIYFGEMTRDYIMTHATVSELDYPKGDENAYTTYDGTGGIPIDSAWRRVLTALYLRDWQMLLTQNFTPKTQVLFRREIQARVRAIAPFLQFDRDPYLVAAQLAPSSKDEPSQNSNQNNPTRNPTSNLFWILDAYTISDRYPYSDPGNQPFNYIRNPVKVVVDAYNGSVKFYTLDPNEPILSTWDKIFKGIFQPIEAMPESLRSHIRYPIDLFEAQSQSLLNYHMTDPQVFYNREDPWRVPNEIYGDKEQPVQPYYLIMKLPEGETEEFVLLYPFTPTSRNNLIAWLAARSDGENYGKRLLYQFPKQELVFGPEQIEALINQDPIISQQISLWNRQGSRVLQGNLLIIPIEESLLYVEPLYLEAEANSVPTLARVIAVYRDRVVMEKTLDLALAKILSFSDRETPQIAPPL
jgi:uncharacterized protein